MIIRHVYWENFTEPNAERDRRHALVRESWGAARGACELISWKNADSVPPTFLDLMDAQRRVSDRGDILFYTSADVGFTSRTINAIIEVTAMVGACHMKRKEPGDIRKIPTDDDIEKAPEYCGLDGCAFSLEWWDRHRDKFPQAHVGFYGWDSICRNIIRRAGGLGLKNLIWHPLQTVNSWNRDLDTIYKHPINQKNRLALYEYLVRWGGSEADHLFTDEELRRTWK